jgi:hypothetical protein
MMNARCSALMVLVFLAAGCYHPAYVSPEPIPAGEYCGGVGLAGFSYGPGDYLGASGMVHARFGFGAGLDAGLRLSFPDGIYGDVKWNFASEPLLLTADLGGSYIGAEENDMSEHFISDTVTLSIYPGLLVGTKTLYGGMRLRIRRGYGARYSHRPPGWSYTPSAMIGASFGDRFRVMPEAEAFWEVGEKPGVLLGVNIEFHAKTRETVETNQ